MSDCYWRCQTCPEYGDGDREAEAHVKATRHSVLTSARDNLGPQMERRYWLTEAGWAAVGGRP